MGTKFDIVIIHEDKSHVLKIWNEITTTLESLNCLLNRFDANSEIAYINNNAYREPIHTSKRMWNILQLCRFYYNRTKKLFDITLDNLEDVSFNNNQHVLFKKKNISIDLGGFAKGYALKEIHKTLKQGNIENAFINFGNSSIMGIGHHPYGNCWKVGLINPYNKEEINEFCLHNTSLSTSGNTPQYTTHIFNPIKKQYNSEKMLSTIISEDPLDAEILSTVWMIANKTQQETINKNFDHIKATIYHL